MSRQWRPPSLEIAGAEARVLRQHVVGVGGVDDRGAAVAAERLAGLLRIERVGTFDQLRGSVVLQTAPEHGLPGAGRDARVGVVVLERPEVLVVVGPAAAGGVDARRPREDTAVVADPDGAVGDRRGVLVGVRGVRASAEVCGRQVEALQREVPVRRGGDPRLAGVRALVDLFETDVEMIRAGRIDDEELVVPGLDARLVERPDRPRLLRRAAVHEYRRARDLRERTVNVVRREVDAREPRLLRLVERERALDHHVQLLCRQPSTRASRGPARSAAGSPAAAAGPRRCGRNRWRRRDRSSPLRRATRAQRRPPCRSSPDARLRRRRGSAPARSACPGWYPDRRGPFCHAVSPGASR